MQNTEIVRPETLTLPKGGGAITGLKGDVAGAGPDGANSLSIPLPINAGRGYAPSLALSYYSRSGNGPFGMGWSVDSPAIRRRTKKGVPTYNDTDEFLGPNGEVIVPFLADDGSAITRTANTLLGVDLGSDFTVHRYRYRVESDFSRLEYWVGTATGARDFWLLYTPDGQVCLYGSTAQARVSHPETPQNTGIWLLESSVSATGEQIYWLYRSEDDTGCDGAETAAHPNATAQRYLAAVCYGNRVAGRVLPGLTTPPALTDWLFMVVFDYGERTTDTATPPDWVAPGSGDWVRRQDCFSSWEYGFEVRTRRLCRQVLSYHFTGTLGGSTSESTPQLVSRLVLNYQESPIVTTLTWVQQSGLNSDGTFTSLPETAFIWSRFEANTGEIIWPVTWQERADLANMNSRQPYQMVDLNGEGIAGILYHDSGAWWYRAPVRQPGGDQNAVTWDKPARLPAVPALRGDSMLADLNGDGYMEWVVTSAGVNGYYARTPERGWLNFTPLSAYPVEYLHPRALIADITGAGLADLALIGPKSVRLYAGTGDGWEKALNVLQPTGVQLPVPGTNERVLVAFSDMAGSGQQHLVEIKEESLRYWPNLGHGQFGAPITMTGWWSPDTFIPANIFLADIDGSGTSDVIIAVKNYLIILINQSGNSFAPPFEFELPDGVRYDNTCELHVADINGSGIASIILTVPHPKPRHYVCNIASVKPWLLNQMDNSMGARHNFTYRSSAQFWLDEKQEAAAAGEAIPASYLPFPLHLLARTDVTDEITGNKLVSTARYRSGAWDGKEREFRGFGFVEIQDTDTLTSQGTTTEISQPSLTRNWFATGMAVIDNAMSQAWWSGDSGAFAHYSARFTRGDSGNEKAYTADEDEAFWLRRATKGMLLRSELYALDDSNLQSIPYQVSESRPQVRLVTAAGNARYPVVLPINAETRSYVYERVSNDPQCSQQVTLSVDQYGQPLYVMTLNYPRRAKPATSPYPYTLPDTLFDSSYDDQQQQLVVTRQENHWYRIDDMASGIWVNGLEDAIRSDVYLYSSAPETGLTLEDLSISGAPLGAPASQAFAGWHQPWYLDGNNNPTSELPAFPPRVGLIETAVLDAEMVATLKEDLTDSVLQQAGYIWLSFLGAWVVHRNLTTYGPAEHFWLPQTVRDSELTGAITLTRDAYDCVVTKVVDAAGLTTQAEYDWRFLTPVKITDVNNNIHQITLDGLGRVTSQRFSGTENGVAAGYSDTDFYLPADVDEALALTPPLPVAQCLVYVNHWDVNAKQPPM
ncbi:SpvB/TcaC N-terminal domain-containing protein [Kosakonia sacchari]|uniref:SpvB/TcaC N-terminal domain-containing protein n=1 Tax=Kosakonia sacchari TaxID=1158459 RepID=UPI0030C540D4